MGVVRSQIGVAHINTDPTVFEAACVLARLLLQAQATVFFSCWCFTSPVEIRVVVPQVVIGLNGRPWGDGDIDALSLTLPGSTAAIIHTFATGNFRLFAAPTRVL